MARYKRRFYAHQRSQSRPLKAKTQRRDHRLPIFLALGLLLAALMVGIGSARAEGLAVEVVATTPVAQSVTAYGVVHAAEDTLISARLLAPVTTIQVREGDRVSHGDLILELDRKGLQAQLSAAQAAASQAQAALKEAHAEFERVKGLSARGSATHRDMERATSARTQALAAATQADSQVLVTEEQLSHTRITAPFAGQVVERLVEVGEMATPGMALMRVATTDAMELWVDVPQSQIHRLQPGQTAEIVLDGQGTFAAKVVRIVPAADPRSHTFTVKLVFSNPTGQTVLSGMFARAVIPYGSRDQLTVPVSAISHRSEVTGVYVQATPGQSPVLRLVRVGRILGDRQVIESGLSIGDSVVIDAAHAAHARAEAHR